MTAQEIATELKVTVNRANSSYYKDSRVKAITEEGLGKVEKIQKAAVAAGNDFIAAVCETVLKYKKISDKQAYCLASFAVNTDIFKEEITEDDEEIEETTAEEAAEAIENAEKFATENNLSGKAWEVKIHDGAYWFFKLAKCRKGKGYELTPWYQVRTTDVKHFNK